MKRRDLKKIVVASVSYLLFVLLGSKLGQACRLAPGDDFATKAMHIMEGLTLAFESLVPSFHPLDLLVGIAAAGLIRLSVHVKSKNAKKYRKNEEYGSARWGKPEDIDRKEHTSELQSR